MLNKKFVKNKKFKLLNINVEFFLLLLIIIIRILLQKNHFE